jgi:hypothetical protein
LLVSAGFTYNSEMTGRWKKWIVVVIALWLPLQGYGAVAMPFCKHGPAMPVSLAAVPSHADAQDGHEGHVGVPHHDHEADRQPAGSTDGHAGLGCNDCGACQLACAPLIVSAVPHVTASGSPVYDTLPVGSLTSVSPKQLQRPPLAALI